MKPNINKRFFSLALAICLISPLILLVCCNAGKSMPCDIYAAHGTPCVTAHSTTRLLYSKYNGPLYQIQRDSDQATLDVMAGRDGYADVTGQDRFCEGTFARITVIYDQSGRGNDLVPSAPGTFKGPDKGEFNTQSIAHMAPVMVGGHKAYGVYIMPGMGYRCNNASGLAINDEPEGIYYVIDGTHYDSGCCFDYGNSSTNGVAVGTGTMETTYYGTSTAWGRGKGEGPWIMSDMEAGLFSGYDPKENDVPSIDSWRFVSVYVNGGGGNQWDLRGADATSEDVVTYYSGVRPHTNEGSDAYYPMHKRGGMLLGNGGDNGNGSAGTFYEGVMTVGYPTDEAIAEVQKNIAAADYCEYPLSMTRVISFVPGSSQDVSFLFKNQGEKSLKQLDVEIDLPEGWTVTADESISSELTAGQNITSTYSITAPQGRSSGFMVLKVSWKGGCATVKQRVRSAEAVKINEIKLSSPGNDRDQFIELYNASSEDVDLSGLQLEVRRSGWAPVVAAVIPEGTIVHSGDFFLASLAGTAVTVPANAGATELFLSADATELILGGQSYSVVGQGVPAGRQTTIFTPVSTGPTTSYPAGTTTLHLTDVEGLAVGQYVGIDLGGNYEQVLLTSVGTPATQTVLSKAAKAGDTTLYLKVTRDLRPGDVLVIDTGARIEKATVKEVVKVSLPPVRVFGQLDVIHEPGIVELEAALSQNHMEDVDVSSTGSGVTFEPATAYEHISGDAVQPLGSPYTISPALACDVYAYEGAPCPAEIAVSQFCFGYQLSTRAGSIALVDPVSNTILDAIVYGSQQSNSSGNGTIASPELATLEGIQSQGGCIAVVPGMPRFRPGMMPVAMEGPGQSLVRYPDGSDADMLCKDFSLSDTPTPGSANIKKQF